jgi:hypothetical protein
MINNSAVTLHTLPRLGQAEPENHAHSPQYEQSGLYIMVDPSTGKTVGGQLVQAEQIIAGVPHQHNNVQPGSSSYHKDSSQHSDQHNSEPNSLTCAADRTADAVVGARLSVCEPDPRERIGQETCVPSGASTHTEPIELLTPAIDHTQGARFGQEGQPICSVSPMPEFSITVDASGTGAPITNSDSHESNQGQVQDFSDVDEHGLDSIATEREQPLRSDVQCKSHEMEDVEYGDANGTSEEEAAELATKQVGERFLFLHTSSFVGRYKSS